MHEADGGLGGIGGAFDHGQAGQLPFGQGGQGLGPAGEPAQGRFHRRKSMAFIGRGEKEYIGDAESLGPNLADFVIEMVQEENVFFQAELGGKDFR